MKLETVLREEIRRLARREITTQTAKLSKAVSQHRRDIAKLKRENASYKRKFEILEIEASKVVRPQHVELNGRARFTVQSVKAQRAKTGLSAADFGKLVGVSGMTIYSWENGKNRPRRAQFARLVAMRGIGKREAQGKLALLARRK